MSPVRSKAVRAAELGEVATPVPEHSDAQPPKRRTYLPAAERRQRIIAAAQKVFARSSLQGARTRELAKAAEINQATLFEHFESKEELFTAAVVEPLLEVMQGMRERAREYEEASNAEELLTKGRASVQKHLETMVEVYPLLAVALFSDPDLGQKLYREQIVPLIKDRAEVMRNIVREEIDPEFLALAQLGVFFAIAMDRAFTGKDDDLADIARQVTNLAVFGFAQDRFRD
jgi:AcrR family transcriptional regulator